MKKLLLVVAMLLIAMPALATVSVTATDKGSGVVEVRYNCSAAEKVRSFALDISVDSGMTIDTISDFNVGESKKPGGGYGIFPGRFADYINASNPNWADPNYTPVAPAADSDARGNLGTSAITVEMGSLYVDVNAPGTSGLLFRLGVTAHGATDANLTIALNNTRIGVVLEDTNVVASPVLTGTKVTFIQNCTVPNVVNFLLADANTAILNANFIIGTITYQCDNTIAAGSVISTNPTGGTVTTCGTAVNIVVSTGVCDCLYVGRVFDANGAGFAGMTVTTTQYNLWVTLGKPNCWCCTSQKRGNGNYSGSSATKTDSLDLAGVKNTANYNKSTTAANACYDFNFSGKVDSVDLARVKNTANYNKATGSGPPCN